MIPDTNLILDLVRRGGIRQTESELRHQLGKREHPLAESRDLYKLLVRLERAGLLTTELTLHLTDDGRARLAQLDGTDSRRTVSHGLQERREAA
jgi:DNA-binding PadR family transcriptional regulator